MPTHHPKYSSSKIHRVIACPASVNLSAEVPKLDRSSDAATRGTALHTGMEKVYGDSRFMLDSLNGQTDEETGYTYLPDDIEAMELAMKMTEEVLNKYDCDDIMLEKFVCLSDDIGGTADMIATGPDWVVYLDYKFGFQAVQAENNAQCLFIACCAEETDVVCDDVLDKKVVSVIVQPAVRETASIWEVPADALDTFYDQMMDAIEESDKGAETGRPGDHCMFCPAAPYCTAKRSQVVKFMTFDSAHAEQLAEGMGMVKAMKAQIKAIEAEMFTALDQGVTIDGWKLVMKRGVNHWVDPEKARHKLRYAKSVLKDMYIDEKMRTAPQVLKALKDMKVDLDLSALITNESSGTTIAPESDKREAVVKNPELPDNLQNVMNAA